MRIGQLLNLLGGRVAVVFGDFAVFLEALDDFIRVAAHVADRNARVLAHALADFDQILAPFLAEFGNRDANDASVVDRRDADVGRENGFVDRGQGGRVIGVDDDQARFGHADAGDVAQAGHRTVIFHLHAVDQTG